MSRKVKVNGMIKDLEAIEKACLLEGNEKEKKDEKNLDDFAVIRRDLGLFIQQLDEGIKLRAVAESEIDRIKSIQIKHDNEKLLGKIKEKHAALTKAYDKEALKSSKKKSRYTLEEIETMKNLVDLFREEIADLLVNYAMNVEKRLYKMDRIIIPERKM
jgi:hypothetical protein